MRILQITFLFLILLLGCRSEPKLTFEQLMVKGNDCIECPQIEIDVPHALGNSKVAKTINGAIREEVIYFLRFDGSDITSIDAAMDSFTTNFFGLKQKFADENAVWQAKINGAITFENKRLITLRLDVFIFTGGAHGLTERVFLNFDKNTGELLENHQLFLEMKHYWRLLKKYFENKSIFLKI